jgi:molybdate transport system permease protein
MGEFGATIMVAGNIPGVTNTMTLSIYSETQSAQSGFGGSALWMVLVLVAVSGSVMYISNRLGRRPTAA